MSRIPLKDKLEAAHAKLLTKQDLIKSQRGEIDVGQMIAVFVMIPVALIIFGAVINIVTSNIYAVGGFNGSAALLVHQLPLLLVAGVLLAILASAFLLIKREAA